MVWVDPRSDRPSKFAHQNLPIKICPSKKPTILRTADFLVANHLRAKLLRRNIRLRPTLGGRYVAAGPIALGDNAPIDPSVALPLRFRPKNFEMNHLAGLGCCLEDRANRLNIAPTATENSPPIVALDRRTQRQLPATGQDLAVQVKLIGSINEGAQQKLGQFHKIWRIGQGTGCLRGASRFSRALWVRHLN
jgi:hypothetical protein